MEILVDEILNDGVHRWSGSIDGKAWTLFCGNAAAALSHIPDESVHCIITSPPYYSLRDYGVDGQIGLEDTVNEYVMAYEWDNYRLTTQVMNGYKGDKIVLDPFEIKNGDLVIDFPSCLVKPRKDMTPAEKSKAKATIQILHLNDEDQANRRCEIVMEYICGNISQAFLESKYPFIAEELQRQDLYEKIKEIIKVPVTTPA